VIEQQLPVNAMTVDVEDYFHVAALASAIPRSDWDKMEYRAEASTHRICQIFADAGIKATFFVLGWVARKSPRLVREIQAAGHEIASHGWSHQLVFNQTREEFMRETRDSKTLLEDICGRPVEGYRASTYSITRRSLWALDVLCELGFRYDSSVFPIHHDVYGIPDAPRHPGVIKAPGGESIVEFPMSTSTFAGVRVPVSGGGYFRLLPYWLISSGLGKLNRVEKRPFVFYLHPWEVDPGQPVIKTNFRSRFRHYTNLHRTEGRLRRLLGEFRFAPMRDALAELKLLPAT
jgi:polysaccharide deacetylase family protein (PEP-CTERM system associated)